MFKVQSDQSFISPLHISLREGKPVGLGRKPQWWKDLGQGVIQPHCGDWAAFVVPGDKQAFPLFGGCARSSGRGRQREARGLSGDGEIPMPCGQCSAKMQARREGLPPQCLGQCRVGVWEGLDKHFALNC